jgi:hypothetical protein
LGVDAFVVRKRLSEKNRSVLCATADIEKELGGRCGQFAEARTVQADISPMTIQALRN